MSTGTILKEYLGEENTWEGIQPVAAPDHSIRVVVVSSSVCAGPHGQDPLGLGHLVVDLPEGWGHLVGQGPGHDDAVGLAGAGTENDSVSEKNQ